MSHKERLNSYIERLQREEKASDLLLKEKNEDVAEAMKAARDLHSLDGEKKADPRFVNQLEEELLQISEEMHEGQAARTRQGARSPFWKSLLPSVAVTVLVVGIGYGAFGPAGQNEDGQSQPGSEPHRIQVSSSAGAGAGEEGLVEADSGNASGSQAAPLVAVDQARVATVANQITEFQASVNNTEVGMSEGDLMLESLANSIDSQGFMEIMNQVELVSF